ncbi:membrane protein, putative [Desulfocucumis palustris]|uniref:Membrane protein, putative n=1 Tax=Desulfocucumis palustris TaxID=1898651 RepID=A0A2L2XGX0_9FIRM|nr:sporulation membrane protein YtaF [Desulfocucumis palustris]GBF35455.1 membrane protein, putative [Desulfocucumis palustris]
MELLTLVLFALALNMDAFGTGVSYGVRKIKLPVTSVLIISMMSVAAITISMTAGNIISRAVSPAFAHRLGGVILLLIGLWVLIQSLTENRKQEFPDEEPVTVAQIRIKTLGLVIRVLREPHQADLDKSGTISTREALLLGAALAMDALGAGFAVSMLGFGVISTALMVGIGHLLLTYTGLHTGRSLGNTAWGSHLAALPGCILITLGLLKLY